MGHFYFSFSMHQIIRSDGHKTSHKQNLLSHEHDICGDYKKILLALLIISKFSDLQSSII